MGSRRDCTWILGLPGFRVVTTNSEGGRRRQPVDDPDRAPRCPALPMQWLWSPHESCAIGARPDVGRCPVGVASRHAGVWAATRPVPPLRHSHRRDRVRRSEGAGHAAFAATDRRGLSVDADLACGRPPRRQLGESPSSGARIPARLGRPASSTTSPVSRSRRDSPRQGAEVLHRALGSRAR